MGGANGGADPVQDITALARVFFRGGNHSAAWNDFRYWGPGHGRFDHHLPGPDGKPAVGKAVFCSKENEQWRHQSNSTTTKEDGSFTIAGNAISA